MTQRSARASVGIALILALVAGASVWGGWALAFRPVAETARVSDAERTYPIAPQDYADTRSLTLRPALQASTKILVRAAGVVTRYTCTVGGQWNSGDVPLQVDRTSILALHTATPLSRDLLGNEKGDDVAALQDAVGALGYTTGQRGVFDARTRAAINTMLKDRHIDRPQSENGTLPLSMVVWLPAPTVSLSTCAVQLNERVDTDAAIAEVLGGVTSLKIEATAGMQPGPRTLTLGATTVPVPDTLEVTDADALARLTAEPLLSIYLTALQGQPESPPEPPQGIIALQNPMTVYPVPPAAISVDAAGASCVASEDTAYPVQVVASSLGVSYVQFAAGTDAPPTVSIGGKGAACSSKPTQ